jgi:hypothetical protein
VPKPKPTLPRLVEQLRILLWFQMHLTLIGLLIVLAAVGFVASVRHVQLDSGVVEQLLLSMLLLVGTAVFLAICAALVRRRWVLVYPLIVLVEVAVIVNIVRAVASGLVGFLLVLVYAALTGWVIADLSRREVRVYLLRLGD